MKILLLDHPQHTHGTWLLYEGLVRVLGRDSITIFPPKPPLYGLTPPKYIDLMSIKWYRDVYNDIFSRRPLPRGIPSFADGEMLTGLESTIGYGFFTVSYSHVIPESPDKTEQENIEEEDLIARIDNDFYDIIILGNSHRVPTIALARLRDRCRRLPPIVYLDAGERDEFNAHWWHVFRPVLTFKTALTPEILSQKGSAAVPCDMYPLPLCHPTILSDSEGKFNIKDDTYKHRGIDILCKFGPTWPTRLLVQQRVEQFCSNMSLNSPRPFNAILHGYDINWLKDTKIGITMRGSGRDTERYWDIPAYGAAMISDGTMGCLHPFPFSDKVTAVFYQDLNSLDSAMNYLLEDEDRRIDIAKRGHEHLRRFHSVEARALFFLGILKNELSISFSQSQQMRLEKWYEKLKWSSFLPEWRGVIMGYNE